jgi:hypothetical protein
MPIASLILDLTFLVVKFSFRVSKMDFASFAVSALSKAFKTLIF